MAPAQVFGVLFIFLICGVGKVAQGIRQQEDSSSTSIDLHSKIFRSPTIMLGSGDVINKYYRVEMPSGHVAIRSLDAELVDSTASPVPLSETYIRQWSLLRYYILKGSSGLDLDSRPVIVPNDGVCQIGVLDQWFGTGSDSRRTNTTVPSPFGIVVGDPDKIPYGFEEAWFLHIHAIDTRGTVNRRGCAECVCDYYNVTHDEYGKKIAKSYEGGLKCCYDGTHCAVQEGIKAERRKLFLEYTVVWVPMSKDVLPVRVYILDVTDTKDSADQNPHCKVEYTVDRCPEEDKQCVHTAESVAYLPEGGNLIYAVAHQHTGGAGVALYNENGGEICKSSPLYDDGLKADDENDYIVGMSACYPTPGSVYLKAGQELRFKSWYKNEDRHTGAVGLFYLLVTDHTPPKKEKNFRLRVALGTLTILAAVALVGVTVARYLGMRGGTTDYEAV